MADAIPYAAIERHGLIGDRRTAALVAADGTIDWLCVPDYDSAPVFGALLDASKGGLWRVGPRVLCSGDQAYADNAPILITRWQLPEGDVELLDFMALPGDHRPDAARDARIVIRRLRCTRGEVDCVNVWRPRLRFDELPARGVPDHGALEFWTSAPHPGPQLRIHENETVWMAAGIASGRQWSVDEAEALLRDAQRFWWDLERRMEAVSKHPRLARSAITIRLLEYAPCGSIVAAPTTSVPERIGGSWNADYRLTWVRDASLCMAALARLGDLESGERYLGWLSDRPGPGTGAPLQVLYTIAGGADASEHTVEEACGYRHSRPVRFGNHAFRQQQHGIFGYLADCAYTFVDHGGRLNPRFWELLTRCADYVQGTWTHAGHGIWELEAEQRYLSSAIMCWTALDRVLRIADRLQLQPRQAQAWRSTRDAIHHAVVHEGWSDRLGAFKQSFENDALDAATLLIPLTGLLPVDDRRVAATVDAIANRLTIDRGVYRFDPDDVPQTEDFPMGQFEAAFLPCTFWLATVFALMGRRDDANGILQAAEQVAGPLGLFAEAVDPRGGTFAGNFPLLFSHVEHIRAVQTLEGQPWTVCERSDG